MVVEVVVYLLNTSVKFMDTARDCISVRVMFGVV